MKALVVALLSLGVVFDAFADKLETEQLVLNYDGFYDRLEQLDEPEYQQIKLAFYLKDEKGLPCNIVAAQLATRFKQRDVYFFELGELLLPYDEKLD
jgi:hypothetical protein